MSLAVLLNPQLPQPALLDAIRHSETGHLSDDAARTAVSPKGAVGPYQFMQKFLRDFGYGMPKDIPISDVQDLSKSRQLADKFITGFSDYHQFTTPLEKLVAYNAGPQFAAEWKAAGANIADLPSETQKYVQKAAAFLTQNQGNDDMAYLGMPSETDPNRTIDGQVINPDLAAMQAQRDRIDAAIRNMVTKVNYPPSRYMDPRLRQQSPAMAMPSEDDPNRTIDGQVINPELQALQDQRDRVDAAIRNMFTAGNYPPSRYMDPRLRQQSPAMAMPSETDATQNIDGTQVSEDAILNQVGQGLTGVFQDITGANSKPSAVAVANPQNQPPAFFNGDPADQAAPGGGMIGKAQAATAGPAASSQQFTKMLSQLGQMQRSNVSGKRRDQSAMAYQPQVSFNDMLIRMGAAGLRGSAQGGLEALAGMGEAYSDAQDLNAKGLAAYQKAMAKDTKGSGTGGFGAIVVNDAISRALPLIGNGWSTGFASYLSAIPGTEAQALKNNLATIKANIGFDKLQAMRDASPTGGALGQVSERELGFLQSVFGSLDQSQSAEELAYNIQLLQYVYNSIIHGEGNHQYSMPVYGGGPTVGSSASGIDAATQADIDKYAQ